jgi:hypothetical protein
MIRHGKKLGVLSLVLLAVVSSCLMGGGRMWTKVSSDFMKADKPYGPGDFRIRGDRLISMKLTSPEITFKPREQRSNPKVAEPSEPWMANVNERANRRTVRILAGSLATPQRVFEERAQQADWWLAPDWGTAYLATGWMDYYDELKPGERYTPQITKLFKSTNQGHDWQRLDWPENRNITFLRFLDAQRGYVIGWGPRIWRTGDGGASWTEIPVPEQARDPGDERKQFDLVALGRDGVLRFAFLVQSPSGNYSPVYALRWGEQTPTQALSLPEQTVTDIVDEGGYLYLLGETGLPIYFAPEGQPPRQSQVLRWSGREVELLQRFEPGLTGYALYLTPTRALLFDGVDESGLLPRDVTAISYDNGRRWSIESEGSVAQGGYYDSETGTRWRVSGYSLYRRSLL